MDKRKISQSLIHNSRYPAVIPEFTATQEPASI